MAFRTTIEKTFIILWNVKRPEQKPFETLKYTLRIVLILLHFNLDLKILIKINVLDYVIAAVLLQKHLDRIF